MEYVLKAESLKKRYRGYTALDGFNMNVPKGSIYGFVGKNGAGKTTLIRLICGLQEPTSGCFEIYGVRNNDKKILEQRKRIGAVVETPSIYPGLTAYENLKMQYLTLGLSDHKSISALLELVGLGNTGKKTARNFSLGMKQRLGIAVALCGSPDMLILDEPINGLDPQGIIEMRELILKLNREKGITVLISSHILDELSRLATHYGFIDKGRLIREMSAEELEKECRRSTHIEVTDSSCISSVMENMGFEYNITDEHNVDIFGRPNISQLTKALMPFDCDIISVNENDEDLESFFMSLIGGNKT